MEKVTIKGKRTAPNGMYWGNIPVADSYKLMMIEPISCDKYRAWTNSSRIIGLPGWRVSTIRLGWAYCDLPIDNFQIFDW